MKNLARMPLLYTFAAVLIVMLGATTHAHAQGGCATGGTGCGSNPTPSAPEIDPSLAAGGVALLGGTVVLVRKFRRK